MPRPFTAGHSCGPTRTPPPVPPLQGVIWRGDSVIDGVPETLDMLRAAGKKLVFVTNNSTKSRKGYLGKFTSLGLNINAVRWEGTRGGRAPRGVRARPGRAGDAIPSAAPL